MNQSLARLLQIIVVLSLFGLLFAQVVVVPTVSGWMAEAYPEFAWARWPLAAPLIAVLACFQVALIGAWQLLGKVAREQIFSDSARPWVNLILGALSAAWLVALATTVWESGVGATAPWILLFEVLMLLVGLAVLLLIVVLRGLLIRATELQVELDVVV